MGIQECPPFQDGSQSRLKILILKPSSLGDVVQALPVLRLLKQHWPGSEIYWWIEAGLSGLLEEDPDLAGIILFDRKGWKTPWRWRATLQAIERMRSYRFDLVIDLQGLFRSAAVAWLARGELTVGVDDPREGARAFYDYAVPRPDRNGHAVEWYLEVLRHLNVPVHNDFTWLPARPAAGEAVRKKWAVNGHRWIVVHPGARWETKRWPAQCFAETIARLGHALADDFHFAIMGGPADTRLASEVVKSCPGRCLDLTGQTSLPEMIEWVRGGELMLTNDTGPMHVAAALGRPVVAMFGPTNPRRTGPFGQLSNVLQSTVACAPCLQEHCAQTRQIECLWSITPAQVCQRVEQLLQPT